MGLNGRLITGNPRLIRRINSSVILDLLRERGPLSRIQISAITGLSFPSVSRTVSELLESGMVTELGLGESSGGRRPRLLAFNARAGYVVGAEVTRTQIRVGLTDLMGHPLHTQSLPSRSPRQAAEVEEELHDAVEAMLHAAQVRREDLVGIGIGVPGIVDPESGMVHWVPGLNWRDVPLAADLEAQLGVPVVVENDVNLALEGERWFGAARGKKNAVFVLVGDGVGAALLLNGQLCRGKDNAAGEVGHWIVLANQVEGSPGGDGQLERLTASAGIVRRWAERSGLRGMDLGPDGSLITQLRNRMDHGDEAGKSVLDETANWLGMAVANIVTLLNPEVVVLGGRVMGEFPQLVDAIRSISGNVVPYGADIVLTQLEDRAVVLGGVHAVLYRERASVTFLQTEERA